MSKTRKVLMMNEAGRIWTEEQETPAPKSGQLLIEVHASMVSPGHGAWWVSNGDARLLIESLRGVPKRGDVRSVIRTPGLSSVQKAIATNLRSATGWRVWAADMHFTPRTPVSHITCARRFQVMSATRKPHLFISLQPHSTPCNADASVSARISSLLDWVLSGQFACQIAKNRGCLCDWIG